MRSILIYFCIFCILISDIVTIIWVFVSYRRYIYVILFESKKKKNQSIKHFYQNFTN